MACIPSRDKLDDPCGSCVHVLICRSGRLVTRADTAPSSLPPPSLDPTTPRFALEALFVLLQAFVVSWKSVGASRKDVPASAVDMCASDDWKNMVLKTVLAAQAQGPTRA